MPTPTSALHQIKKLSNTIANDANEKFKDEANACAWIISMAAGLYDYIEAAEILDEVDTEDGYAFMLAHYPQATSHPQYVRRLAGCILICLTLDEYKTLKG